MKNIDVGEIVGLRFVEEYEKSKNRNPKAELVCRKCCTKEEWQDFLETEKGGKIIIARAVTKDDLSDMGRSASEMICNRCQKRLQ